MPRRITKKDSRTIYVANRIGTTLNGVDVYDDIFECEAQFSDLGGGRSRKEYGTDENYSFDFLTQINEKTKKINQYSKVWVFTYPRASSDYSDYIVQENPISRNGQFLVSCTSSAVNENELYYLHDDKILKFVANFDSENSVFYVGNNYSLPIDYDTVMWYNEPDDVDDEDSRMEFVKKTEYDNYTVYSVELK